MLCSVIPYTKSIDDRLVTYHLPDEFKPFVKIGSSVKMPWGNETIIGIVAHIALEIPFEGTLKSIISPHCTVALLSSSEIALLVNLARRLFARIHTIAQLFVPLRIFDSFEDKNFLEIVPSISCSQLGGIAEYSIAPDTETLIQHLKTSLQKNPGAVIVPDGLSVQWWYEACEVEAIVDPHPKALSRQKKIYLEILEGSKKNLFGTRRTLLKRLGHFKHIYVLHENLSPNIMFGLKKIPIRIMIRELAQHGHIIHYMGITPGIRTITHFLQEKKSIQYLE